MKSTLVLVALFGCVFAEVANFEKCEEASDDICEINEISITPCSNKDSCKLKKGKDASISFDYTPKFVATKMRTSLFWASPGGDVPFPTVSEVDACPHTSCPLEVDKKNNLQYTLNISKKFPSGVFKLKWILNNEENKEQLCCFKTTIVLRR